jgi:hypothetical protein
VVNEGYHTIFPVTYSSKFKVKQFHQAMFTREFDVVGDDFVMEDTLELLQNHFKNIQFRTHKKLTGIKKNVLRVNQYINLQESFSSKYSTNAKRLIKKSNKNYTYKVISCVDELIMLVKETVAHKIKEFTIENIVKLNVLMISAVGSKSGETIAVFDGDNIVAAGFFLKDKKQVTYLKGASTDIAKKNGAMFGLMDFAFTTYSSQFNVFDFGGSDIDSVATFYKKFGAKDRAYFEYNINNLPLWFKGLKKLKK